MRIFLLLFIGFSSMVSFGQNVGIGTNVPHGSAALEIQDTSRGILIPRMTMVQRNAIANPAEGLMVYQTDSTRGYKYFDGVKWSNLNTNSENGLNTLINTSNETPSQNCPYGGIKIELGVDSNKNNVLDNFEINQFQTKFICQGSNTSNSINNFDTISNFMKYIGDGREGDFNINNYIGGELNGEHFFKNFRIPSGSTLNLAKNQTVVLHIKDTCIIEGTINGNGRSLIGSYSESNVNRISANAGETRGNCSCQCFDAPLFTWSYSPDGLAYKIGSQTKTVGMSQEGLWAASYFMSNIHGYNSPSCYGYNTISEGGSGLYIICKVIKFTGTITLKGGDGTPSWYPGTGGGGGGGLIISADDIISNNGTILQNGGLGFNRGSGNGYTLIINR